MTDVRELAEDLRAEQEALDGIVAALDAREWERPTPSPGWTVADQVGHLTYFDGTAALAITDADAFKRSVEQLLSGGSIDDGTLGRDRTPQEHLAAWRANRTLLSGAASTLTDDMRILWYGPSMSAKSFVTARLMETWAHGQDIVDAVGADRRATDRLRHIAQLGFITRGWTYKNRGLSVPETDVRVELVSPGGDTWGWGPDGADALVSGPALDFCLVVTQRRHLDDTELKTIGDDAREWLLMAQAFAGPATDGPTSQSPRGTGA